MATKSKGSGKVRSDRFSWDGDSIKAVVPVSTPKKKSGGTRKSSGTRKGK